MIYLGKIFIRNDSVGRNFDTIMIFLGIKHFFDFREVSKHLSEILFYLKCQLVIFLGTRH